ncbi:hypothetical protein K9L16_03760 [Candidatus Pacearchaeota archaeon]|nr:hypothetical protein [Candidatus Pacearchaeota archaeon]
MHKAKCGKCGKECEVPFKPTEGRPVYCRDCFSKQKPQRPQRFGPRNNQRNQRFSGGPRRR